MLFMPMIRTNAPRGSARTPYSVSPRWKLHSRGPKPRKNCVAFIPVMRAVTKCPASWRKTEIRIPTAKTNIQRFTMASQTSSPMISSPPSAPCHPPLSGSAAGASVTDPPAMTSLRKRS